MSELQFTIQWVSSIIYIAVGIISSTRFNLKVKVKIWLNFFSTIANTMWFFYSLLAGDTGYIWVGLLYVMLSVSSVIVNYRIYKKAKKGKVYTIL